MDASPKVRPSPEGSADPSATDRPSVPRGSARRPGRLVDRLEGLALPGHGAIGGLWTAIPTVLWAQGRVPPSLGGSGPITLVSGGTARPGHRALELHQGEAGWSFSYPVSAPEVSGHPGAVHELGSGGWYLRWPLSDAEWSTLAGSKPGVVILGNARSLWAEGEPFVRAIAELRSRLGAAPLLWTPRVALPHRLAFLTLVSVDIVDSTAALWAAGEGVHLERTLGEGDPASFTGESAEDPPGGGPGAASLPGAQALTELAREQQFVGACVRSGRLRELVEARQVAEPALAEMLRYADRLLAELFDQRVPVVSEATRSYVLRESFRRPEVARFRRRFLERYAPPPSKRVLVLVPCSKTKPYRSSRSHRRFATAVQELPHAERLHFVSVTSPLGVVPRELEDLYPARHYDIPVTGDWDEQERAAVVESVAHLVATGRYDSILAHLDPEEYGFLGEMLRSPVPAVWTYSAPSSTSSAALDTLRHAAAAALSRQPYEHFAPLARVREELESIARMQFGDGFGQRLLAPPVRLHGRPWFQRISDGAGRDLATWQERRGLFQLTVHGAARIFPAEPLCVEVQEDVLLQGDLFTPGVARAGNQIRPGDAVLLARGGRLLAVGEAVLPGPLMTQLPHGLAVRVRHRVHDASPPAPTAT